MTLTKIGASLGGAADTLLVTQSNHLFVDYDRGKAVRMLSTGLYALATADDIGNADAVGIILQIIDTNTLLLALSGRVTVDGCVPTGTAGTVLFLPVTSTKGAQNTGLLLASEPSNASQVSKPMAVITISGSEMILFQMRGEVISTGAVSIADGSIDNDAMADNAIDTDEIAADAVTNAKLANMATRTVKANATSGSANPTDVVMADGDFLIANASGLVTVPIAGDVAVSNTGAAVIQPGAVDIGMLSASGTASSSTFLRGDNAWAAAGATVKYVASDITVNNSTTFVNVTGISQLIGANEDWGFRITMIADGSSSYDFKYQWSAIPSGATGVWGSIGFNKDGTFTVQSQSNLASDLTHGGQTVPNLMIIEGFIINGSTAGTIQLQFAQYSAGADNSDVKQGTFATFYKLA